MFIELIKPSAGFFRVFKLQIRKSPPKSQDVTEKETHLAKTKPKAYLMMSTVNTKKIRSRIS